MKTKNRKTLLFATAIGAIVLLLALAGCTFTFGKSNLSAAPDTTGYVTMTTADDTGRVAGSVEEVVAELAPKVVEIYSALADGTGAGSGVIVGKVNDEAGVPTGSIVVTNHHVIADATEIKIRLNDGNDYTAKLVGSDPVSDIAVLHIAAVGIEPAVWITDSDTVKVGSAAIVIGNPLGTLGGTVTKGIISATEREVSVEDGLPQRLLQTDAAINGGNSGGGIFSETGLLIGIVNAKVQKTGVEGLGFAIPANTARTIATTLAENIDPESGFGYVPNRYYVGAALGTIGNSISSYVGVYSIDTQGAAAQAGLLLYDRIVSATFGGETVTSDGEIQALLLKADYSIGDRLVLKVRHYGSNLISTITVVMTQFVYKM